MAEEVEVKILEIDRKSIEAKLLSLGARKTFEGVIYALMYDYPDERIRKNKDTMRLRKVGCRSFLTYKRYVKNDKAKIMQEHEVEVSDFEATRSILESLGLKVFDEIRKNRTTYELSGVHYELDTHLDKYAYIPEFIEIEAHDLETVYENAKLLGFSREQCMPWNLYDVVKHYTNKGKVR